MTDGRTIAKRTLGRLAATRLVAQPARQRLLNRTNIVYAHRIGGPSALLGPDDDSMTLDRLHDQLTILQRYADFAPLSVLLKRNLDGAELQRPLMALTFDDGFDMASGDLLELLDDHRISATAFLVTSTVDNASLMWRHRLRAIWAARSERDCVSAYNEVVAGPAGLPPIATGDELMTASARWPMNRKEELADAVWEAAGMPPVATVLEEHRPYFDREGLHAWTEHGHAIGLHTHTHPFCARLSPDAVSTEIVEPALWLRATFGLDAVHLSYPFGSRLPAEVERRLFEEGVIATALGNRGFARRGTPPYRLERASIVGDMSFAVLGRVLVGSAPGARS